MKSLCIPKGILSSHDDEEAAQRRKELREKLLKGEEVKVTPAGHIKDAEDNFSEDGIIVPSALSIYNFRV
jgi:hypothetical protein